MAVRREGLHAVPVFRVILLLVGAVANPRTAWLIADTLNALMAIPYRIALLALPGTVFAVMQASFEGGRASA